MLGLLVRLPFLPRLGHAYDQDAYRRWMGAIQDHGLAQVFERTDTDYVGYHYILWALAQGYGGRASAATVRDKELRVWLKLPGLAGDLLTTGLVALVARSLARGREVTLGGRWRRAAARLRLRPADLAGLVAAALFLFHPAVLYAGSYWGQQDSLVTFFMLLAAWLAWRGGSGWAGAALAVGTIVKPQPLVLVPVLAWLVWQRSGWRGLLRSGLAGAAVLVAGHVYFILTGNTARMWQIYTFQISQNEHLSFSAYNLWWPFERLLNARPESAILSADGVSLTYGFTATALVLLVLALAWRSLQHTDLRSMLLAGGAWLAGYYLVASGSHERYALPALAFLLPALALAPRLRWPLLLYSAALFANLIIALPLDRRWAQGDQTWLTLVVAGVMTGEVVWLLWVVANTYSDPADVTPDPFPVV